MPTRSHQSNHDLGVKRRFQNDSFPSCFVTKMGSQKSDRAEPNQTAKTNLGRTKNGTMWAASAFSKWLQGTEQVIGGGRAGMF